MNQFIYPYVLFKDTQEAVDYYISVFGGEVIYTMYGKDIPDCPEDQLETIYHLQYKLHGHQLYFSDSQNDSETIDHGRIMLHLDFENRDDMEKAYQNMAKDGGVIQELGETHWGAVFGVIKDKYDVVWQYHYTIPQE
jgi:PhnB protein